MSLLFRAFYAMPPMNARDGSPTGALYGFLRLYYNIVDKEKPDFVVVCIDRIEKTFRKEADEKYKANRPPAPDDMIKQLTIFPKMLESLGIPVLSSPGFEADDVIATVARLEEKKGNKVILVSGDRDILQSIDENITAYINKKGVSEIEVYTPKELHDKLGLTTQQYVWYKAMKGDPTDNYLGVPGVGEKTALAIATSAKRAEDIEKHPKIEKYLDEFKHSLILAQVRYDVPVQYTHADLKPDVDNERALGELRRLGFNTLVPRFSKKNVEQSGKPKKVSIEEAEGEIDGDFALYANGIIQVATADKTIEIEVGTGLFAKTEEAIHALRKPLSSKHRKYVLNLKELVRKVDVAEPVFDVQLAAYLDDPGRSSYGIGEITSAYLDDDPPPAQAVMRAAQILGQRLDEKKQLELLLGLEQPLSRVLAKMEDRGIKIDKDALKSLSAELEQSIAVKSEEVYKIAGTRFNIGSPKQLAEVLFEKMQLPSAKKTKTGYSTSADVLDQLRPASPIIDLIIDVRELAKLKSTYVDTLPGFTDEKSRVHTTYLQTGTATGRLSSANPNLQNIPIRSDWGGRIRQCFVAEKGHVFVSADYSQIELRLLAHLSEDPELIKAFHQSDDIHTYTAKKIFGVDEVTSSQRRAAKVINFGVLYGMSAHRLSNEFKISYAEADKFIKDYFSRFKGVSEFVKKVVELSRKNGYTETILGRRRYIPELNSSDFQVRSASERAAVNSPIQGSAADIIKMAMIRAEREFGGTENMLLLQIHDELVIECPKANSETVQKKLKEIMEGACKAMVPFVAEVHVGANLLEAK